MADPDPLVVLGLPDAVDQLEIIDDRAIDPYLAAFGLHRMLLDQGPAQLASAVAQQLAEGRRDRAFMQEAELAQPFEFAVIGSHRFVV